MLGFIMHSDASWGSKIKKAKSNANRRPKYGIDYQVLECRRCLALSLPTSHDQYMLELVNLARSNPTAYANLLGITLNEGLAAGTISTSAKQPLAFNLALNSAAQKHSQWMLDVDVFSHTGSGGSKPEGRMRAEGYSFTGNWTLGENIAIASTSMAIDLTKYTRALNDNLILDKNYPGRGHRRAIMNDLFSEIGIGVKTGIFKGLNSAVATQDFAKSGTTVFVTGVAFADSVLADKFYTPGEGLGGISIRAIRDGSGEQYATTTWSSGGYSLALPAGRYSIMASGLSLGSSQFINDFVVGTVNRKLDFVKGAVKTGAELAVLGKNVSIVNGDTTPTSLDDTFFGSTLVSSGTIDKSFSIKNWGNSTLFLTGTPKVTISGPNASDFTIYYQPGPTVAGGASGLCGIRFNPSAPGTRTAVIQFANSDSNENPFRFTVSGIGADGIPPFFSVAPNLNPSNHPTFALSMAAFENKAPTAPAIDAQSMKMTRTDFPVNKVNQAVRDTLFQIHNDSTKDSSVENVFDFGFQFSQ